MLHDGRLPVGHGVLNRYRALHHHGLHRGHVPGARLRLWRDRSLRSQGLQHAERLPCEHDLHWWPLRRRLGALVRRVVPLHHDPECSSPIQKSCRRTLTNGGERRAEYDPECSPEARARNSALACEALNGTRSVVLRGGMAC